MKRSLLTIAMALGIFSGATLFAQSPAETEDINYSIFNNAGFEQGLEGWKFSDGWNALKEDTAAQVLEIRTDGAKAGGKYLRVKNERDKGFYGVQQEVKFEPNTAYRITWWSRGTAKKVGQEQGSNRLRFWGYGGPEYSSDIPYKAKDWEYHEYTIYATRKATGGVSLWVWPNGHCDIDNFTVRKAFWTADKSSVDPGQTVTFNMDMSGQKSESVKIEYQITTSEGQTLKSDSFSGTTPLKRAVTYALPQVGYYKLLATAKTPAGTFKDEVAVSVTSPLSGIEAVQREWARK